MRCTIRCDPATAKAELNHPLDSLPLLIIQARRPAPRVRVRALQGTASSSTYRYTFLNVRTLVLAMGGEDLYLWAVPFH